MHKALVLSLAALVCLALATPSTVVASTYITFDVPGSSGGGLPQAVNKWGSVTGWYSTGGQLDAYYGFLYQPNGSVITFLVPGQWRTIPLSISDSGWIAGYYYGQNGVLHGFLRNPKYTTLDAPGAGTESGQGTEALSINDAGEIAGVYFDSSSIEHGFTWSSSAGFTTFDIPGGSAVTSAVLNQSGEVAGSYNVSAVGATYSDAYVMDATGNITTFAVPDWVETFVAGINSSGQIAGYSTTQSFFRDQFGNITTFSITGYEGTAGIEDSGTVVGLYKVTSSTTFRGWQRTSAGVVSYFKDPSAGSEGTFPTCVSSNGKVAGYYFDSQGNSHDFEKTN